MSNNEEQGSKRVKTNLGFVKHQNGKKDGPDEIQISDIDLEPNTNPSSGSKPKFKSKKLGTSGIVNTINSGDSSRRKKAMSLAELNMLKEKCNGSGSGKKLTSIIDVQDESDVSLNNGSSPFKIIRSSQDFNLDTPVANRTAQRGDPSITPTMYKTRPSSDDGIFWIRTPQPESNDRPLLFDKDAVNTGNETKLPSSPLKIGKDSQIKDLPDTLLDPELKGLLEKYKENQQNELTHKPLFMRSHSDSRMLNKSKMKENLLKDSAQTIAAKGASNGNVLTTFNRHNNIDEAGKLDLSEMLVNIGTKLRNSAPCDSIQIENVNENDQDMAVNNSNGSKDKLSFLAKSNANFDSDNQSSDDFSDDIDVSELVVNATQAVATSHTDSDEKKNEDPNVSNSDDTFSDDDDDILERIESGLTQQPSVTCRSNTDQTEFTDTFDSDTNAVAKEINLVDLNTSKYTAKYKGMITAVNSGKRSDNSENSKPFQLYNENENLAKSALHYKLLKRLQIKDIRLGVFKRNIATYKQVILKCLTADDKTVNVMVRDHWTSLEFKVGDVVHIIMEKQGGTFQLVDKDHNLLIWNPDTLISATRIADAIECKRRSILNQKFNGPGVVSLPFIIGNITHFLFQQCLLQRCVREDFAEKIIVDQIELHAMEIYAAGKEKEEVKDLVTEQFSYIREWIGEYVPLRNEGTGTSYRKKTEFKATNILDIEENIMSPIFGIRGLIDVVIEAELQNGNKYVIPLEIKTGKEYLSNRAQVALYTLLIKQRYEVESFYTSLVYTKLHTCYLNALKQNDFKLLVNIRNELSQYLVYAVTNLPEIIQKESCERCFSVEPCMVLNKLVENGCAENSGINTDLYEGLTGHLNNAQYKTYYEHWDKLITKEEGIMNFSKTDLWRNSADYRESNGGYGVGNLSLVGYELGKSQNKFVYMFERDTSKFPPLTSSQLNTNDRIILSDEKSMFGLTWGYIRLIRPDIIVITTDRNWSNSAVRMPDFNIANNQTFRSVLRNIEADGSQELSDYILSKTFRIDRDQMFHGMAVARFNLLNLFLPDGDYRRRELIVELKPPEFSDVPNFNYEEMKPLLNSDQLKAIDMVSKIEDYCLILGMPGTGKTTVIGGIIDCIIKSGMSVLISSYTHSAVDNICEKIIRKAEANNEKLPLLRVGSTSKMNPIVQPYSIYSEDTGNHIQSKSDFEELIDQCQIVATTCLGISDIVFGTGKKFDYCIIDEASQVTLPIVLGPISFCDKFVLVGDHYQLPPLVLHPEAKMGGLDQSLFKILSDEHPSSVIELTHQYRMCSDIMSLSNELIYNGRLKCGSEAVANQQLKIPHLDSLPIGNTCLTKILDPKRKVVFVNEDNIEHIHEVSIGDKIDNPGEAKMIVTLIKVMLLSGIQESDIGVMAFYKAQLKHFFIDLKKYKEIEILTADRFQGRDKDIIIISLVRSDIIGDLLKEWRRVNVAMTRARCKLIIFGSKQLLESEPQFEGFMEMINHNGWYYDLQEGDEKTNEEFDFFENDVDVSRGKNIDGPILDDSQGNVIRIDPKSRIIRRSKILKYVLEDL